jgi:undecaprenyl-diphosphatase
MQEVKYVLLTGIVEGITEFLPISSTGHLILLDYFFDNLYENSLIYIVVIQLGAISAICIEYRSKLINFIFFQKKENYHAIKIIFFASIPAALFGFFFHETIKANLFNPLIVVISLVFGGIIIIIVENRKLKTTYTNFENMSKKKCIYIGLFQCLALIPGTSRSGATIIGGMLNGLNRKASTEFSFFLAIPVMFGAASLDLYKNYKNLFYEDLIIITSGFLISFFTALFAIKLLILYLKNNNFIIFGWYRIFIGLFLGFIIMY